MALTNDDNFLYSGSMDTTMKQWNVTLGVYTREYIGHSGFVPSLLIDNDFIFTGSSDASIRMWNFESTENVYTLYGEIFLSNLTCSFKSNLHYLSSRR